MKNDGKLDIAIGLSVKTRSWKNKNVKWSWLVTKLTTAHKTNETFREYHSSSKDDRDKIKDVGGYVGGYLYKGKRSPQNVNYRQLVTLDLDYAHAFFWDDFLLEFNNAAVLHATHSHSANNSRYRLIMPLSREVSADEYVAISRKIAGRLGVELFDNTTFETNRLMFWPSCSSDVEYYAKHQDGLWVDADDILASYTDWTDTSTWPTSQKNLQEVRDRSKKQEDPDAKKGVIGAFCRTYSISEVIEKYLKDVYTDADEDNRYTYKKGSTSSGLVVYDDKYAYSHHGTDPCGGKLSNAFDLVRLHKFGYLDSNPDLTPSKTASYKHMERMVLEDKEVKKTIASENFASSKYDFADSLDAKPEPSDEDLKWTEELEINTRGEYVSSATNINLILKHDSYLSDNFKHNEFDHKIYVFNSLPWRRIHRPEPIRDVDLSGIRNYLESIYGIVGQAKIKDALILESERNNYHPVRDYLSSVHWDGTKRLDTFLIDYFGTEDSIYHRESIRLTMVAAVARIFDPGIKFDLMLVLVGEQGTGKSTFIYKFGRGWSSDSFLTVNGKEAFEQLQGSWLIEMAELAGIRKADVEATKHFISKQEDKFRKAYGEVQETHPRQCVFIGTTNDYTFLRDATGNRRFMPVDIGTKTPRKSIFDIKNSTIDLIWAEAVEMYRKGQKLTLSDDANAIAKVEQHAHSSVDEKSGIIEKFLYKPLPSNWDDVEIDDRRLFFDDPLSAEGTVERTHVCVAEIWCECLGKPKSDMDRYKTREIHDIMRLMDAWERSSSTKNFPIYGKQKFYVKKAD